MEPTNSNKEEAFIRNFRINGGFEVPEGYFEASENTILNKTIHSGFSVPEHYFDNLSQRIEQRTSKTTGEKAIPLVNYLKWGIAVAASFVAIAGIYFMLPKNSVQATDFSSLSEEEIINYIEVSDFQDHQLIELAAKSETPHLTETEEYLINTAEADLIIEEL